jgi:hypothetical protein
MSLLTMASSAFLLLGHGLEAVIERRTDLGDGVLQRADRPHLLLIVWLRCSPRTQDAREGTAAGASFAGEDQPPPSDETENEREGNIGKGGVLRIGRCDGEHVSGGEIHGGRPREERDRRAGGELDCANGCAVLEQSEGGCPCRRGAGNGAAERGGCGETRSAAEDVPENHRGGRRLAGGKVVEVIGRQVIENVALNGETIPAGARDIGRLAGREPDSVELRRAGKGRAGDVHPP